MTRARIAALALVNWKGVFYERYLLDRHVTALEGANGAGKTTVMIAAYVALLPDMSKLRFTNLGESGAIGGDRGIWGRLGEAGRPSYTVLDLEVDGERLLAGVRLNRASEPTVEPTAFLVTGLAADVRLSDILLVRQLDGDHIPQLDEIAAAVKQAGGALETFKAIKDYFAALFERGVTPMRLATDEERGKLNEMLRTSMTGGISRALTSELRGFLLKEESGLGDTLSRMRANLEACRRTRVEVSESRQLEREITAIYEAGAEMFAAAVHATRLGATEAQQRIAEAKPAVELALRTQRDREDEIVAHQARERVLEARRASARAELARVTAERDRRIAVDAITFRLGELERELTGLATVAHQARAAQALATAERAAVKTGRLAAREAYDRASLGLAHLQQGLDELVRRAHGHRQLERRLAEARALLAQPALAADTAAAALTALDERRAHAEAERARLDRSSRDLAARRDEHARALAALQTIEPTVNMDADALHRQARAALSRLAEREAVLGRAHELEREQRDAERLAVRQAAARQLAAELKLVVTPEAGSATAVVVRTLDEVEQALAEAEADARDPADPRPQLAQLRERLAAIDDRLVTWVLASQAAHRLAAVPELGPAPTTPAAITAIRDRVIEAQRALAQRRVEREAAREQVRLRATALERSGTATDPELARLRDELGGELLAERFEDLDVEAASWVEARLGPLATALIVDDPAAAARKLKGGERTLPSVWLVAAGSQLEVEPGPDAQSQLALETAATSGSASAASGSAASTSAASGSAASTSAASGNAVGTSAPITSDGDASGAGTSGAGTSGAGTSGAGTSGAGTSGAGTSGAGTSGAGTSGAGTSGAGTSGAGTSGAGTSGAGTSGAGTSGAGTISVSSSAAGGNAAGGRVTSSAGDDVITREPFGMRVTRRAAQPTLGRRARERQVAELYAQVARDGEALDELTARTAVLASWRRDAEQLAAHAQAWLAGDPTDERGRIHGELGSRELAAFAFEDRLRSAHARATEARRRRDGLRRLLGDAALIDGPEHAARAAELGVLRDELAATRLELERVAAARATLTELGDVLRRPPPDDAERAAQVARIAELGAELDRLFLARAALEDVLANRQAAAWGDAEQALAAESSLAPALERQHADARAAAQAAEEAEAAADTAWEAATAAAHEADAQRSAATAHRDRAAGELVALGGPVTVGEAADQESVVGAAIDFVNRIEADLRALVTAAALAAERRDQAARAAEEASAKLTSETRAAGPAASAWAELRATADTAGLLQTALASAAHTGRTSVQLTADAWSKREVLLDRVARARGGTELADAIRALALEGPSYLHAWQLTREWLRHRVPAQVVEVDEPLLALERLRSHLDVLEGRLARQEHDLRGASEDVARGIDIQLRRAGGQVRRLNQHLDGIKFGSVHGIRVELRRIERMEQILRALRLGEAQELLFMSSIPIEEALDEIFRRYGGGRGGGERLLDYREYLELAVQIRRQTSGDWESASPTRLSTGEAIGVGAAVMMVVLTEWERDANLLRARRTSGSLRFLFLDEANRLSRDNLGVLFDLCHTLDLQLLIAAPEVARAEGNTTYRLVRHVADDGREEVLVTGRRAAPTTDEATPSADEVAPAADEAAPSDDALAPSNAVAASEALAANDALAASEALAASDAGPTTSDSVRTDSAPSTADFEPSDAMRTDAMRTDSVPSTAALAASAVDSVPSTTSPASSIADSVPSLAAPASGTNDFVPRTTALVPSTDGLALSTDDFAPDTAALAPAPSTAAVPVPSSTAPAPETNDSVPSTAALAPSTDGLALRTGAPAPGTTASVPSTAAPAPGTNDSMPSTAALILSAEDFAPSIVAPAPVPSTAAPVPSTDGLALRTGVPVLRTGVPVPSTTASVPTTVAPAPGTNDSMPSTAALILSAEDFAPSIVAPAPVPSTAAPVPSTDGLALRTGVPVPSTTASVPSSPAPAPGANDSMPSTAALTLSAEDFAPSIVAPAPVPSTAAPVPSTAARAPGTNDSAPSTAALALRTDDFAPSTVAPAPSTVAPAPSTVAPAPSTVAPAPSTVAPAPAPRTNDSVSSTAAPVPSTAAPTPAPSTAGLAPVPSTAAPTPVPSTARLAPVPSTAAPVLSPAAPTPVPSTAGLAPMPSTAALASAPSTAGLAPVPSTARLAPGPDGSAPSTGAPVPSTAALAPGPNEFVPSTVAPEMSTDDFAPSTNAPAPAPAPSTAAAVPITAAPAPHVPRPEPESESDEPDDEPDDLAPEEFEPDEPEFGPDEPHELD